MVCSVGGVVCLVCVFLGWCVGRWVCDDVYMYCMTVPQDAVDSGADSTAAASDSVAPQVKRRWRVKGERAASWDPYL